MLRTASTKVLVNGRPGNRIYHARGLRQGDPLSPLLFVIVMEVLNALIHEADRRAIFTPLPDKIKVFFIGQNSWKFPKFSFYPQGPIKFDIGQNFPFFPASTQTTQIQPCDNPTLMFYSCFYM